MLHDRSKCHLSYSIKIGNLEKYILNQSKMNVWHQNAGTLVLPPHPQVWLSYWMARYSRSYLSKTLGGAIWGKLSTFLLVIFLLEGERWLKQSVSWDDWRLQEEAWRILCSFPGLTQPWTSCRAELFRILIPSTGDGFSTCSLVLLTLSSISHPHSYLPQGPKR